MQGRKHLLPIASVLLHACEVHAMNMDLTFGANWGIAF